MLKKSSLVILQQVHPNDIKRATSTARAMVMQYGMSDKLGLITYGDDGDEVFIGRESGTYQKLQ